MKLSSISVSRYRSILEAAKIDLGDLTVLIGKNNEGKSNFLQALETSFLVLGHFSQIVNQRLYLGRSQFKHYEWNRDFPISYMNRKAGRRDTTFRLYFDLSENELIDFNTQFEINLSTTLTIEITLGERSEPKVRFAKQGQSSAKLDGRIGEICDFILSRFTFLYIPSIRTEKESTRIINALLSQQLLSESRKEKYRAALAALDDLERPLFERIATDVLGSLREFLPNITSVRFEQSGRRYVDRRGDISIIVNDGQETQLSRKGDGVKSMFALALFKHGVPDGQSSLLAIEEPEAHLHAGAIHDLKDSIRQTSSSSQVLISTHSHSFISRDHPRENIIVHNGQVRPARSVVEIRQLMGVRASDNLLNADVIIIVEGHDDEKVLRKIFSQRSSIFEAAVKNGTVAFDVLGGAGRLSYKASTLRRELFSFMAILDGDEAGKQAAAAAIAAKLIEEREYRIITVQGLQQSELEDCIKPEIYQSILKDVYDVNIERGSIPGKGKWSERMQTLFTGQGKLWDSRIKEAVKILVADAVEAFPGDPVADPRGAVLAPILSSVEDRIRAVSSLR